MKVLIVDDSKALRMVAAECIKTMGHEISQAENGQQAIEYVFENDVDLVIMDVEMPGKSGFETTMKIRAMEGHDWFPIVFITAKIDDDSFAKGILAGGDAYLHKPINQLRLQWTITAMERIYSMRQKLQVTQKDLLVANEELKRLSLYDQLTGLANRRNFDETLHSQFMLAKRKKLPLTLLMCDIDYFKLYNDLYGHQKGDNCLAKIAKTFESITNRPTDKACRYGGEEFALILSETDLQGGLCIAEKLRQAVVDQDIQHQDSKVASCVTLSLGLVTYTGQFKEETKLLKAADDALYRAKENGRNRVESC